MKWHDCKTDPPKKAGHYLLVYIYYYDTLFDRAEYSKAESTWFLFDMGEWTSIQESSRFKYDIIPIRWAEVELPEYS